MPHGKDSWLHRINTQMAYHRHHKEADGLEQRVSEEPTNPALHEKLGVVYHELGQTAEAVRSLYQAAHLYGKQGLGRRSTSVLDRIGQIREKARGPGVAHLTLRAPR